MFVGWDVFEDSGAFSYVGVVVYCFCFFCDPVFVVSLDYVFCLGGGEL